MGIQKRIQKRIQKIRKFRIYAKFDEKGGNNVKFVAIFIKMIVKFVAFLYIKIVKFVAI